MTDNNTEERSLEDLVQNGTTNDVSRKLEADPINADDENYQDYYLIISAFGNENMRVAKFLIEQGFRVYKECKPHAEKTPLHYALELADYQLIRLMLFKGAVPDITAPDDTGRTPMHTAIDRSEPRILKILLDYTDKEALNDMHILHDSVKNHDIHLMKKLLKKGLSPLQKNMYGETAFCVAVREDHVDALCLLWDAFQDSTDFNENNDNLKGFLIVAIILDNVDILGELVDNALPVDSTVEPSIDGWALFEMFAGYSLLHFAVKYVQLEIVHFLLENEADVTHQDATGSTPFHIALENKEEGIEQSVDRYKIVEEIIDLLFYYVEQSNEYVNIVNEHGISHFHVLCTRNNSKRVKFFLKNGASIDDSVNLASPIYQGYSPLHFAARYGHKRIVELLIRAGANIEQEAFRRTTPLHVAAKEPSIGVARTLVRYGADITRQDSNGNTPVHYAFDAKNYAILDFLLSVHAIINANPINSRGISHFHIACSRGDVSIVANFLLNNASVSACVPLDSGPYNTSYQRDEIDWRGCTPLHFAAAFGRSEVVQLLLDRNACVEVTNALGYTPFHLACQYNCEKFRELVRGDESIVEVTYRDRTYYEESFIDVTAMENELKACHPYEMMLEDDDECSMVDWSSNRKDHIQTIEQLMKAHCDVDKLDAFGNGALFYMCYFNLKKIFARLIDAISCKRILHVHLLKSFLKEMCLRREVLLNCLFKSRNVNLEKCYKNGSILHYVAVIREYTDPDRLELLKRFLNRGADVNATDDEMQTPLHLATKMRDVCCVNILLEYNANVDCVDGENSATPLHIVTNLICQESIEIVQMLMLKDVDVNAKQSDGKTALHNLLSSRVDYSEFRAIFGHLIVKGVDVNARDGRGETPLVMACTIVNSDIVKELLEFGADVTLEDGDGRNIYQYVYGQVKSMMKAYQKFPIDMYEIFLILLNRAVKLDVLKQLRIEKILRIWYDLKDLKGTSSKNQDLDELRNKCLEEVALLRNTKIHNNITLCDLLTYGDGEMGKYAMNDVLRAVLEEDSFSETYSCYGNMLYLKCRKGEERIQLLPKARQCLTYLTKGRIPICLSEDVLKHLNNVEIRDFIRIVSAIKCEKKTPIAVVPLKVEKDHSKYSRLA